MQSTHACAADNMQESSSGYVWNHKSRKKKDTQCAHTHTPRRSLVILREEECQSSTNIDTLDHNYVRSKWLAKNVKLCAWVNVRNVHDEFTMLCVWLCKVYQIIENIAFKNFAWCPEISSYSVRTILRSCQSRYKHGNLVKQPAKECTWNIQM